MPYLNWKQRAVQKQMEPRPDARSTLTLSLSAEDRAELLPFLEEVFMRGGSELRLDLPGEWIVFWKRRETESRLLLAHPQPQEWVTTIALEQEHGQRFLQRLALLSSGDALSLSEDGAIGSMSNVDVIVTLK